MKVVAVTLGDRYGVGPELVARIVAGWKNPDVVPVVVGERAVFSEGCRIVGVGCGLPEITGMASARSLRAPAFMPLDFAAPVGGKGHVSAQAGAEVLNALAFVVQAAKAGYIDGIVYAPLNKQAMRDAGHEGGDESEYFGRLFGGEAARELNQLGHIWTSRITSHVPLSAVAGLITEPAVRAGIERMWSFLIRLQVEKPQLAVAALNPHAGEGGVFGREEIDVISPAIAIARSNGVEVVGPIPADTVFPYAIDKRIAGIVTMYHDQGQIALKLMGLGRGVTFLAGLPVPVATAGHGTAFDIAGTGQAIPDGMQSAIDVCVRAMGR